jgi:hypothetical protein
MQLVVAFRDFANAPRKVALSLCKSQWCVGEVELRLHLFLTSALDGRGGQLHASASLPPWKLPSLPTE